ncbi:hypothetical protein JCM19233_5519 [Vibrio astriarenae]|nr:hypothetical protein JCM19233_5519 [Vibrio sp. C7]
MKIKNSISLILASGVLFSGYAAASEDYLFDSNATLDGKKALTAGTQEFGLQGDVNFDYADDFLVNLQGSYGYFIVDNFLLGGDASLSVSDNVQTYKVGVFGEYNFDFGSKFVPYVGAGAQFLYSKYFSNSDTSMNMKSAIGVKYFIAENIAVTTEVNYNIANDDLYVGANGNAKNTNTNVMIGTRYYF